jgi:hypothetical protein
MLFMCQGKAKPGLSPEDQQKVVGLFAAWRPPAGLEIKAHYVSATGGDFVVVETDSVTALLEATALWAPYVVYEVTPIIAVADGVGSIRRADETRRALV